MSSQKQDEDQATIPTIAIICVVVIQAVFIIGSLL